MTGNRPHSGLTVDNPKYRKDHTCRGRAKTAPEIQPLGVLVDPHHPPKRVKEPILGLPLGVSCGRLFLEDVTRKRGRSVRASEGGDHLLGVRIGLLCVAALLLRRVLLAFSCFHQGGVIVGWGALLELL